MRILNGNEVSEFAKYMTEELCHGAFSLGGIGVLRFRVASGPTRDSHSHIVYELYEEDEVADFIHDFVTHERRAELTYNAEIQRDRPRSGWVPLQALVGRKGGLNGPQTFV